MYPLRMGRLIDNSIDSEDVGALVFWAAGEEYLTIDLTEDADDPTLIRTQKPVPEDLPAHLKTFLANLFAKGDVVRVSSLKESFYTAVDVMKTQVKAADGSFYDKKGTTSAVVCVLAAVLLGLGALLLSYARIPVFLIAPILPMAAAFVASFVVSRLMTYRRHKIGKSARFFGMLGGLVLGCILALIGFLMTSPALSHWVFVAVGFGCACLGCIAGASVVRNKKYNEKLGHILGFKQFITVT